MNFNTNQTYTRISDMTEGWIFVGFRISDRRCYVTFERGSQRSTYSFHILSDNPTHRFQ